MPMRAEGDFPGEIYVAGVVYEELYEGVSARKISEFVRPDYVIIGEASDLNLKIGQRGRAEIVLETVGKPAHSANPEKGVNAVKKMMKLLAALEDYVPGEQEGLGKGILELTDIISTPYPGASVVPERCTATLDRRLLVGGDETERARADPGAYRCACGAGQQLSGDRPPARGDKDLLHRK
jgi:acetylornithine deacetylase/succinyl-diaminopimelate desuccinylase-like protein